MADTDQGVGNGPAIRQRRLSLFPADQKLRELCLVLEIQAAGRFIQQQNRCFLGKRPGKEYTLKLPAG